MYDFPFSSAPSFISPNIFISAFPSSSTFLYALSSHYPNEGGWLICHLCVNFLPFVDRHQSAQINYYALLQWCLQMGLCLPCSREETIWTHPSSRIRRRRICQKALSSRVVTCLLTHTGPYWTKSSYGRQVVNLNIYKSSSSKAREQALFWRPHCCCLAALFSCSCRLNTKMTSEHDLTSSIWRRQMYIGFELSANIMLTWSQRKCWCLADIMLTEQKHSAGWLIPFALLVVLFVNLGDSLA